MPFQTLVEVVADTAVPARNIDVVKSLFHKLDFMPDNYHGN